MGGGAWKVAYADFVTAMMAFFLLLWVLSMVPPDTKAGLAAYFSGDRNFDSSSTSPISNNPFIQNTDKKISDDAIGALKEYEIKPALWSKKDSYISELIA